ncbi:MAG: hypothetical protein J0M10_02075 [Chitinophagales bacterium]|nr:hypothetical protein [Chitinophagales bacterium]
MPFIFIYILKVSLSLGVVFLFYHLVLRRLTFYNWNRWYLMGYSVLCFFLPFIDISIALEQSAIKNNAVISWVPVLGQNFINEPDESVTLGLWDYAGLVLLTGILIMLIRFCIQLWSIRRMRRNAVLLSEDGMRLYQVDAAIIPFSFGDSIFINKDQHTIQELEEIIRHEFVHVKQKHSVDIIWGELLCLFNWYNPFAWLLKKSIRQNLEFIADRQVLEQGMDRKQYQYLLLKVVGNNQFSIANQFNFSSLKKRIAMMNKLRSAKVHLVKFMFVLPLVSVMLLAFRNEWKKQVPRNEQVTTALVTGNDTIPDKLPVPPPPPPPAPKGKGTLKEFLDRNQGVKNLGWVYHNDNSVAMIHVIKNDGKTEIYHTDNAEEMNAGVKKYGRFPVPPGAIAPPAPKGQYNEVWVQGYPAAPADPKDVIVVQGYPIAPPVPAAEVLAEGHPLAPAYPQGEIVVTGYAKPPVPVKLPEHVKSINIRKGGKAIVELKNGKREEYDLTNPEEKKKFDALYPAPPPPPPAPAAPVHGVKVEGVKLSGVSAEGKPLPDNLIYVINGKISTKYEMEKISPEQIASVDVLKGNSAIALYGENAKEGVVRIKLKDEAQPLYVINGDISTKEAMDHLKPEQIESIDVLKGEKATAVYGDKGKNGVLVIKTKQ